MILSNCECGERAVASLAENGKWMVSCVMALSARCTSRVYADTVEEAIEKWEKIEYHAVACPEVPAVGGPAKIPEHWWETFTDIRRHNQLEACCRRTDNKTITAIRSNSRQFVPDIYIFKCTCGRQHRRFCVGSGVRPYWEVR